MHSGAASGIVPSSFRIARQLLSRIEDETNGIMTLDALFVPVPSERIAQARSAAKILGDEVFSELLLAIAARRRVDDETMPTGLSGTENLERRNSAITAIDGYPLPGEGGNVNCCLTRH